MFLRSGSILRPSIGLRNHLARRHLASFNGIEYRTAGSTPTTASPQIERPLSPHLTIYEPQLTWLMSIAHRFTGVGLAAGIYGFGCYYALIVPEAITPSLANWIATTCPAPVLYAGKYAVAAPFVFHTLNGIRHLVWDMVWGMSLKNVYLGGWIVNIGTLIGAGLLTTL